MSPHRLHSLPSELALPSFGLSSNGFLPAQYPVQRLSDTYYEPWELAVSRLPQLIRERTIRDKIDALPMLGTSRLDGEGEWQRAFLILSVLSQSYIWAGDVPSERLPPVISVPYLEVASHLELLPVASYAALNLWNWRPASRGADLTNPDNLESLITFTGTEDESWFFVISNAMEARAGSLIRKMLVAIHAVTRDDFCTVTESLQYLANSLIEIGELLERMDERCSPQIFYHHIRPFLGGSLNQHLPRGVFYDEGNGQGSWRRYRGGSNGQSSLVQFFDAALGIDHKSTRQFHQEMRRYMPGPHARFLDEFTSIANVRQYVLQHERDGALLDAYNAAVRSLSLFRDKHIQLVTRYVILPSRMSNASGGSLALHLLTPSTKSTQVVGTGGTSLVPFLRQSRDETKDAIRQESIVRVGA